MRLISWVVLYFNLEYYLVINFRRGAAFGIAGMIKGLGILSLKQHDIMNILAKGMQDKKNFKHREGKIFTSIGKLDFVNVCNL
jgi:hypothetical protein